MDLIRYYIRKFFKLIKTEVFVLPSRMIVLAFFLYVTGIASYHRRSVFIANPDFVQYIRYFCSELGPFVGFHRSNEFWACPFLWRRGLRGRTAESTSRLAAVGKHSPRGPGRRPGRVDYRHSLSQITGHLSGTHHPVISPYFK